MQHSGVLLISRQSAVDYAAQPRAADLTAECS